LARQAGLILRVVDADLAIIKGCGLAGHVATTYEQVGYSVADVVAKAVFGVLNWAIASGKSAEEAKGLIS
jgi:hypothetical protein